MPSDIGIIDLMHDFSTEQKRWEESLHLRVDEVAPHFLDD